MHVTHHIDSTKILYLIENNQKAEFIKILGLFKFLKYKKQGRYDL